ncbi:hypothetical protein [[Mycoplasma] anseris]|nr:hypothetical protein [[Mycoplasma] anseris]
MIKFYLATKSVKPTNETTTMRDKTNILIPNGIYNDNHKSAINTN